MDAVYWLRILNSILAASLVGVCLVKADWRSVRHRARSIRIAGLTFIAVAIAWGSTARRNEEFRIWLPFLTIGLSLCLYGMFKIAEGEPSYKERT